MRISECDRCGQQERSVFRELKVTINCRNVTHGSYELCDRCEKALADFLRPLPREGSASK